METPMNKWMIWGEKSPYFWKATHMMNQFLLTTQNNKNFKFHDFIFKFLNSSSCNKFSFPGFIKSTPTLKTGCCRFWGKEMFNKKHQKFPVFDIFGKPFTSKLATEYSVPYHHALDFPKRNMTIVFFPVNSFET